MKPIRHGLLGNRFLIPLLILCSLLFYATSLRGGHNWGGDFSQYILHAQNLLQGRDYTDLGYVQTLYNPVGPRAYPPGYPASLVPLLALFGLNFVALKLGTVLFFGIALAAYWRLARANLPLPWAVGCLMFLALSPWALKFSNNILSDIPYLALSLLAVYAAGRFFRYPVTWQRAAFAALTLVIACSFRTAGVVLIGTAFAYALLFRRSHLLGCLLVAAFSSSAVFLIYHTFDCGTTYLEHPSFHPADLFRNLQNNLSIYKRGLLRYLALYPSRQERSLPFLLINNAALVGYIVLAVWGGIRNLRRRGVHYFDLYIPAYLSVILLYPFAQKTRYLLPIIPLLSIHALTGFRAAIVALQKASGTFRGWIRGPRRARRLAPFIPAAIYTPLFLAYWFHYTFQPTTVEANILRDPDVGALFETVRTTRQDISGVIFHHPRVLTLFTGARSATCYNIGDIRWDLPGVLDFSAEHDISHLILGAQDRGLRPIVLRNPHGFQPVYRNGKFTLYRILGRPQTRPPESLPAGNRSRPSPELSGVLP